MRRECKISVRKNCKHKAKGGLKAYFKPAREHEAIRNINGVTIYRDIGSGFFLVKKPNLIFVGLEDAESFVYKSTTLRGGT